MPVLHNWHASEEPWNLTSVFPPPPPPRQRAPHVIVDESSSPVENSSQIIAQGTDGLKLIYMHSMKGATEESSSFSLSDQPRLLFVFHVSGALSMAGDQGREHYHFLLHDELSALFYQKPPGGAADPGPRGFHLQAVSPLLSFTDLLHGPAMDYDSLGRDLGLSCSAPSGVLGSSGTASRELMTDGNDNARYGCGGGATPLTPNSSVSSSSTEAAGEEDGERCKKDQLKLEDEEEEQQAKDDDEGGDTSKKV